MPQRRTEIRLLLREPVLQALSGVAIYAAVLLNITFYRTALAFHGNDFGKFFYGIHMWRSGASLYAPTSATHLGTGPDGEYVEFLNLNPPHFHVLVWPLTHLPLNAAFAIWMLLNVAAGVTVVLWVTRELELSITRKTILPLLAGTLGSAATATVVLTGQFAPLLALPVVGAWVALRRGRDVSSGMCLGLALSLKPFLATYPALLLVRGSWRAALVSGATALLCYGAGAVAFGVDEHIAWVAALRQLDWAWSPMNGSLLGLITRALPDAVPLRGMLWFTGAVVVAVVSAMTSRRSLDDMFAVAPLAALLISPLGWVYYTWLLVPGLACMWKHRIPPMGLVGIAGLAMPYLFVFGTRTHYWASVTIGSVYSWGMLLTWIALVLKPQGTLSDHRPRAVRASTVNERRTTAEGLSAR